jgi:hypothetical protein
MATITRAQIQKELVPGLKSLFGLEYNKYPEEHLDIYEVDSSEKAFEEELKLSGFGAAVVKPEGSSITYDSAQEAWVARFTHETVSLGFMITEEAMEDNLYESLSKRYTKALARAMAHTKQVKAASLLNTGFTTYKSGDNVYLFSASHPLTGGGVVANKPSTDVDLNETSIEAAVIQISQWTDERGLLIAAKPKRLVIPPQLMFVATRILKNENRPGTADRDINAIVKNNVIPGGFAVNHYLTDTNAWFMSTDVPNGMKMFKRRAYKFEEDSDFETGNLKMKASERYSFGVADPLGVWGTSGS